METNDILPTVCQLYEYLNSIISPSLSLDWDNDGLLCCPSPDKTVRRVLLTLDVTPDIVELARDSSCDVIISHHPVIFRPVKALVSAKLITLVKSDIAVMSFHTRLDILQGGVNDILTELLDMRDTEFFADGAGRIGTLGYTWDIDKFCGYVKYVTGSPLLKLARGSDIAYKIAEVSGSGGDYVSEAVKAGADTFISGEIGYHHMLDAAEAGMNAIEIGHFYSEKHIISFFEAQIRGAYPDIKIINGLNDIIKII